MSEYRQFTKSVRDFLNFLIIQQGQELEKLEKTVGNKKRKRIVSAVNTLNSTRKKISKKGKIKFKKLLNLASSKRIWTIEEDFLLFELHSVYGNSWKEIVKFLPFRTDCNLKNHFNSNLRKVMRKVRKNKFDYVDFHEKIIAFYILLYVKTSLDCQMDYKDNVDYRISSKEKQHNFDNIINKQNLSREIILNYFELLNSKIVSDKYVLERFVSSNSFESIGDIKILINALIFYDIMHQGMIFVNNLKEIAIEHYKLLYFINSNLSILDIIIQPENILTQHNQNFFINYQILITNILKEDFGRNQSYSLQSVNNIDNNINSNKLILINSFNYTDKKKIILFLLRKINQNMMNLNS